MTQGALWCLGASPILSLCVCITHMLPKGGVYGVTLQCAFVAEGLETPLKGACSFFCDQMRLTVVSLLDFLEQAHSTLISKLGWSVMRLGQAYNVIISTLRRLLVVCLCESMLVCTSANKKIALITTQPRNTTEEEINFHAISNVYHSRVGIKHMTRLPQHARLI